MPQKVNAIINGYEILKSLANQDTEQGVTQIAMSTQISPSTCFNILKTLSELGLARFNPITKGYSLGLGAFELARQGIAHNPLMVAAQPHLVTLAEQHNATITLWNSVSDFRSILIAMGQNPSAVSINFNIGSRQPVGAGSTGRARLSASETIYDKNNSWLKSRFKEVNWQGDISFDEYVAQIDRARKIGYAIDRDQYYKGICSVATSFEVKLTGKRYCITAILLSGALKDETIETIGRKLKATAKKLSKLPE